MTRPSLGHDLVMTNANLLLLNNSLSGLTNAILVLLNNSLFALTKA